MSDVFPIPAGSMILCWLLDVVIDSSKAALDSGPLPNLDLEILWWGIRVLFVAVVVDVVQVVVVCV